VFGEGEPARFFYVLLDGEVALYRRVGAEDVEINRTSPDPAGPLTAAGQGQPGCQSSRVVLRRPSASVDEAGRGSVTRLRSRSFYLVFPAARFFLIGATQVVRWELVTLRDLGGRSGRRVPGRVITALNTLIADQRRGGSRGEPAVLVDPVRIPVPALSHGGAMGHKLTLPRGYGSVSQRR
jgi:hypothetical protein